VADGQWETGAAYVKFWKSLYFKKARFRRPRLLANNQALLVSFSQQCAGAFLEYVLPLHLPKLPHSIFTYCTAENATRRP
jgi:hypothetical protein